MEDNLGREIYAQKIANEIAEHYDTEKSLVSDKKKRECENIVFAISGKWGEGKTALLNLIEKPLTDKGFKLIRFNPWKYSQEDITLKRAFLGTVKEELKSGVDLEDLYYDRTKTDIDFDIKSVLRISLAAAFIHIVVIPVLIGWSNIDWLTKINEIFTTFIKFPIVTPLVTLLLIPIVIKVLTISRRGANVSTAEEFEKRFKDLIDDNKKIVIFIDDLDRCNPKTVKTILDSLRTFFQHPECSYIITGDHTVVERYAGDELELADDVTPEQKLQEGRRFLKKLFDVYWRMPLPTPYQFEIFVDKEITLSKIELGEPQSLNIKSFLIDSDLFERNPRHVKRFITKLRFAIEGVKLQKEELEARNNPDLNDSIEALRSILGNPDLLGKVLLFEEFFYPVYEKLILNPEELINHEKLLRAGTATAQLKIKSKTVLELFGKSAEDLEKYATLVRKLPKFTDEDNSTIHEVANYFSFSGSTGLPSTLGPDEANFVQYLKAGQLESKLGAILSVSTEDKKSTFADKVLSVFDQAEDIEKDIILSEALKLSRKLDEWASRIPKWKKKMFALTPERQNKLANEFWRTILEKRPNLLSEVKKENPVYLNFLWDLIESDEKIKFTEETRLEIEKVLQEAIIPTSLDLKGAEIYLKRSKSENFRKEIEKCITTPAEARAYWKHLNGLGFAEGEINSIVKKRLKSLLGNFSNFDWIISNVDHIKNQELYDHVKNTIKSWSKDIQQFIKIVENKNIFELNETENQDLVQTAMGLIKKSADLEFLQNASVQALFDKENKKKLFEGLKSVLADPDESIEKQKKSAEMLMKSSILWNGLEINDVYETLKEVKKLKFSKIAELKEKPKEILESWGYDDKASDKNSEK